MSKIVKIVLLLLLPSIASATCKFAYCNISSRHHFHSDLSLISSHDYRVLFFKVFTIDLYINQKQLLDFTDEIALQILYHRAIDREKFIEESEQSLLQNPNVDYEKIKQRLDLLNESYLDVKEGDVYLLTYQPNRGSTLYHNGRELITVEGQDFAKAYFSIWLSEYSFSQRMTRDLIG